MQTPNVFPDRVGCVDNSQILLQRFFGRTFEPHQIRTGHRAELSQIMATIIVANTLCFHIGHSGYLSEVPAECALHRARSVRSRTRHLARKDRASCNSDAKGSWFRRRAHSACVSRRAREKLSTALTQFSRHGKSVSRLEKEFPKLARGYA